MLLSCFASPEDHLLEMQLFKEKKFAAGLMVYLGAGSVLDMQDGYAAIPVLGPGNVPELHSTNIRLS